MHFAGPRRSSLAFSHHSSLVAPCLADAPTRGCDRSLPVSPLGLRTGLLAVVLVCGASLVASAQGVRADRPFRGLFGAADQPDRRQLLALDWNVLGGYDDNLVESSSLDDTRDVVNGTYTSVSGGLTYVARQEHSSFGASAESSGRYYPDLHALNGVDGGGSVTLNADLGRRTKISLAQSFAIQPYYGIDFIGGVVPAAASAEAGGGGTRATALSSHRSQGLDGRVTLNRTFTARTSATVEYSYRSLHFGDDGDNAFNWQLAKASLSRNLTRHAALRVGYGYGVGGNSELSADSIGDSRIVNHNLDLGIDYDRQLSFSRRTRVTFSSGSTGVVDNGTTTYRVIGNAGLIHELGRTWRAIGSFNRGVQYLPGFGRPFFADTAELRIAGLMQRRIEASAFGGYSSGHLGIDTTASSYFSSTAGGNVRVALSRKLSCFAQYTYYRYGFDGGVQVPFGLPPQLDRQAIRFGVSGWLPLVR
jgi:hypothetical protein